ncbi:MAG: bifunctional folylpolyglutamate synthase/dihydrofolate synthase [Bacillota bacterium]
MSWAVNFLNSLPMFRTEAGFKPGLDRVDKLLKLLECDLSGLNFIHVAGSNGKGSTIALLESIYEKAGYVTGRYTSPHIRSFYERIRVGGNEILEEDLTEIVTKIKAFYQDDSLWQEVEKPTFFEVVTAAALKYFQIKSPDMVLIETGLGGRLDATNIIPPPLAAVITTIDLEHTQYLGDTLAEIAREKAGIIKPGSKVITGETKPEPLGVIEGVCSEYNLELIKSSEYLEIIKGECNLEGQSFQVKLNNEIHNFFTPLKGSYQLQNISTALTTITELQMNYPVSSSDIAEGLAGVDWPGRLEVVQTAPPIILDGSHTPAGMESLASFLQDNFDMDHKIKVILAVLDDKDIKTMLANLHYRSDMEIIFTSNRSPRALQSLALPEELKNSMQISSQSLVETVFTELESQKEKEVIIITGSLTTILEVREKLYGYIEV